MDKNKYLQAHKLLHEITPLAADCGKLCSRECCSGDESTGMLLFPGEEEVYENIDDTWFTIADSSVNLSDGYVIKMLTCRGICPRELRPLGCRIFPLMPYITSDDLLEFRPDLKGIKMCPILMKPDEHQINEEFIDALYDAFEELVDIKEVVEFVRILSDDRDDMVHLTEAL